MAERNERKSSASKAPKKKFSRQTSFSTAVLLKQKSKEDKEVKETNHFVSPQKSPKIPRIERLDSLSKLPDSPQRTGDGQHTYNLRSNVYTDPDMLQKALALLF